MSTAAPSKHLATRQPMQPLQSTSFPLRAPAFLTTPSQPPASASQTTPAEFRRPSLRAAWYWENRKAPNRWYWAAVTVLCTMACLSGYLQYRTHQGDFQSQDLTWGIIWSQSTLMLSMWLLPLALGGFAAQIAVGEHQGRNWQRMSANRLETAMVAGKLLHGLQVAVATTAILVLTTTLTGLMAGFGLPDLTSYLPRFGAVALGMWVILTLVTWLGAVLRSFTTTMTTVVLGTIAGTAMFLTAQPLSVLNPMTALTRATASLNPGAIASADSAASDSLISVAWVTLFALALLRTVKTAVR